MRELLAVAGDAGEDKAAVVRRWGRIGDLFGIINATAPASLHDCAVKLRFLADPEVGIVVGERDDDVTALRQVLAFVEALAAAKP